MNLEQEVFEKVAKHLFKQGERSMCREQDMCRYVAGDGKRCAIGALLTKEALKKHPEIGSLYRGVGDILKRYPDCLGKYSHVDLRFLAGLQNVHDIKSNWYSTEFMRKALKAEGKCYDLNTDFLENLEFEKRRRYCLIPKS